MYHHHHRGSIHLTRSVILINLNFHQMNAFSVRKMRLKLMAKLEGPLKHL